MKEKKSKEKYSYCMPDPLAKFMSKVDMRAQMEAGMLSQFLLLIGLTFMVIYMTIYFEGGLFYKFLIIFNMSCGWLLIGSYLVTTYQQYVSYMEALGIDPEEEKRRVKLKGNIFKRIWLSMKEKKNIDVIEELDPRTMF